MPERVDLRKVTETDRTVWMLKERIEIQGIDVVLLSLAYLCACTSQESDRDAEAMMWRDLQLDLRKAAARWREGRDKLIEKAKEQACPSES